MGVRGRNSEKKVKEKLKKDLRTELKGFTRAKAEKALREGADPSEERFAMHRNIHIRVSSWKKLGSILPDDEKERAELIKDLRLKIKPESSI